MTSGSSRLGSAPSRGTEPQKVSSYELNSDLEDMTPAGSSATSGNNTPLSDYSPHRQPFAERPEHRTAVGAAARQSLSSLPSPPPFTPTISQSSDVPQHSAAGSNMLPAQKQPIAASDTPGVMSTWQPCHVSPGSSSVTFAFTPVGIGATGSPDAQPFGHSEQAAQPRLPSAAPRPADIVRAASHKLTASHESDARSDASGSVVSTSSTTRSFGNSVPGSSPGDILRAATSKLSAQHAISGSSRIHNPQRRKSGALTTPLYQKISHAPTPHSTPLDAVEMRRSDDLADQPDAESIQQSGSGVRSGSVQASPALQSGGSLKVRVVASPPAASPCKSTKSPGSRSSVVSIGSVCGAAALTPFQTCAAAGNGLEVGKYTPTMKLDFSDTRTPVRSSDRPNVEDLPDSCTGLQAKLQFAGNKAVLRDAMTSDDSSRLQDQLQAALEGAAKDGKAAPDLTAEHTSMLASNGKTGAAARAISWLGHKGTGRILLLLLAAMCLVSCSLVAVQMLPSTALPPGMACTPQNAKVCRDVMAAQLHAAEQDPGWLRLGLLRAKWYVQDGLAMFWMRRLPENVTAEQVSLAWMANISSKQIKEMTHDEAVAVFGDVPQHLQTPEVAAKLADAAALEAELQAVAAEEAARKAAAEKAAAEEARLAAERAAAERRAAEKAAAERRAAEKAEAERRAKEKAEAERRAKAEAEAEQRAKAEAEAERRAKEKAEAERRAAQKAEEARIAQAKAEAERRAREQAAAERAAEEARLAARREEAERLAAAQAEAARQAAEEAERFEAARAAAAQQEDAEPLAHEQTVHEATATLPADAQDLSHGDSVDTQAPKASSWSLVAGLVVLLLSAAGGGGYLWLQVNQAAAVKAAQQRREQQLNEIRSNYDETEGQAYQDLGEEDPDRVQQPGAAVSMAAAAGAVAAGVQEAAVAVAVKIMTPISKAPVPRTRAAARHADGPQDDDPQLDFDEAEPHAAGNASAARRRSNSSRAGAARAAATNPAATPRGGRRGSKAATADDSGADSDAGAASTGRARAVRSKKVAATPGRALGPLIEDAPADVQEAAAGDDGQEAAAPSRKAAARRQSAPAAPRRRASASAAGVTASELVDEGKSATPLASGRRSTRAARTPRV